MKVRVLSASIYLLLTVHQACASRMPARSTMASSIVRTSAPEHVHVDAFRYHAEIALPATCALTKQQDPLTQVRALAPHWSSDDDVSWLPVPPPPPAQSVRVQLKNLNTREALELALPTEGDIDFPTRSLAETFFRCRRTGKTHEISQGLLKVLSAVAAQFPGRAIEIVSGFRTYPNGVRDSKHFEGRAIDFRIPGVKTTKVRDFVWKHFQDVGVGYYVRENFVHIDYRPEEKDTAWTVTDEGTPYTFNPSWALRIRSPLDAPAPLTLVAGVSTSDHKHL